MASVNKDAKGWRVLFVMPGGKRKQVRLGKITKAQAQGVALRVGYLVGALDSRQAIDPQTQKWVRNLPDKLYGKLANAGLVTARASSDLEGFVSAFIDAGKTANGRDAKPLTLLKWHTTQKLLGDFFGDCDMRSISPQRAAEFRGWLAEYETKTGIRKTRAENTIRKHIAVCKMLFSVARRRQLIDANPFDNEPAEIVENRERDYFVGVDLANAVLEACPDHEWQLLFALCRFGGLRCPSEVLLLEWQHVLWDRDRIIVTSPKTEHHSGKDSRIIPIFKELRSYLESSFDRAEEGSRFLITRYRNPNSNLRTQLKRIVEKAGKQPWPKLFQNLRSSCETELLDAGHPPQAVAYWMGHSIKVQQKHYAQVHDGHYEAASGKVAHIVAQNPSELTEIAGNTGSETVEISRELLSVLLDTVQKVAETGLEPV